MPLLSMVMQEYVKRYGDGLSLADESGIDPQVKHISGDSREMIPESVFCCVRGEKFDGKDFVELAVKKGATALFTETLFPMNIPQILTSDIRRDMGRLASIIYGEPSRKLKMFAVTGTNGKSTTSWIIRHILQNYGTRTGLFGTIVYNDGTNEWDAGRTTPESYDIQRSLAQMVDNGCSACVMEASSHGLFLGRLEGCVFDGAVFTNLSEEHLDFHETLDDYFEAKKFLFSRYMKKQWWGAVNRDDVYGRKLKDAFPNDIVSFGMETVDRTGVTADCISVSLSGTNFFISFPEVNEKYSVSLPLSGHFNVYNALGAVTLLGSFISDRRGLLEALRTMVQVPGRVEKYCLSNGVCVVIDFAHTPVALQNILSELREMCSGFLISVFGHGGERFEGNRFSLGYTAAEYSDRIVITMDNPRGEDPEKIAEQIMEGVVSSKKTPEVSLILDREKAVHTALEKARKGDVVAVTGKGPEKYLLIGSQKIPYSDRAAVFSWVKKKGLTWK